jgi:IS605 OrfB family transposase
MVRLTLRASCQPEPPCYQRPLYSPTQETPAGLEPAASETEALAWVGTASATTGSRAKGRQDRALSYRFLRDGKGWRVFVSTECASGKQISDRRLGAIGIDINVGQLVLAELDRFGNFLGGEGIGCVTYGKTRAQAKAILGDAVKQALAAAIGSRKPIVVERLEFAQKKASLENEGRRRARMLSSFAYRQTLQYLQAAAFRAGVEVIAVNPPYTSTIGAVNYATRFDISIHQGAAAIAIARRGLGLSERPAVRVAQWPTRGCGYGTLLLPARNRSQHV